MNVGSWGESERFAVRELGHLLFSEGRQDLAKVLFEGLVAVDPEDVWARVALGVVYRAEKRYDDAVTQMDEALRLDPKHLEAAIQLGEVKLLQGQSQEARGCAAMAEYIAKDAEASGALRARLQRLLAAVATSRSA